MFKEMRALEYTLEILRAFNNHPGNHDSKSIYEFVQNGGRITASLTYIQKILPRMVKMNILISSEKGYSQARPLDEITVSNVLDMCDMPGEETLLYNFCDQLKKAVSLTSIDEFYNFN